MAVFFLQLIFFFCFLLSRLWIPPCQTQTVAVTCYVPPNIEIGSKDRITFSARGVNSESQSAILTVTSPQTTALVNVYFFLL